MTATTASSGKGWLSKVWEGLKEVQRRVSVALTVALLFLIYWTVLAAVALVARLAGTDLLHAEKPIPGSHWLRRGQIDRTLENYLRQF